MMPARPQIARPRWSSSSCRTTRLSAASSRALGGLGAHIVSLRKSEPSLEDVFVELVGRGLDDSERDGGTEIDPDDHVDHLPPDDQEFDGGEPSMLEEAPREPVGAEESRPMSDKRMSRDR